MSTCIFFSAFCLLGVPLETPRELAETIRLSFDANLAASDFGAIHFERIEGFATSSDAARRGEFADPAVGEGFYAFNDRWGTYRCIFPVSDVASRRVQLSKNSWVSRLSGSKRAITNGKISLFDSIGLGEDGKREIHTAQIEPGVSTYSSSVGLLFAPHLPVLLDGSLSDLLKKALTQGPDWSLDSIEDKMQLDGVETLLMTLRSHPTGRDLTVKRYWVDPTMGAIPRKVETVAGEGSTSVKFDVFNDDIRLVGGKLWLPHRMTMYSRRDGYTYHFKILSTDFAQRPKPSEFVLEFPQPRKIVNAATMVTYAPRKVWDLSDLPASGSKDAEPIVLQQPSVLPPAMPEVRPQRSAWPVILMVVGALAILIAAALIWRRRRA